MGRFVGKMAVGGRLLDETIGGSIHEGRPGIAPPTGRVALSNQAEELVRSADVPIHLIAENGPTLRVVLGRSRAVGEIYIDFEFVGVEDDFGDRPIFSIRAYPDLRAANRPDDGGSTDLAEIGSHADAIVLPFAPLDPARRRRACSEGG